MKRLKLYAILITMVFTMALLPACSIISSMKTAVETEETAEADADGETPNEEATGKDSLQQEEEAASAATKSENTDEAEVTVITIEILAEIVEIEDDGSLVVCDTDGNVYEMTMPESYSEEEAALFIVGAVLKISYEVETTGDAYPTEAEVQVSLLEEEEAEEVRNTLIEKGFVTVEFDYDEVLAYYEELYAEMDGIIYSPEKLTDASQAAWGTDEDSEEWATVAEMEETNLWGWINYLFESMDPDNDASADGADTQASASAGSAAQTQEEFTYVNNVSAEGVVQLTNEYRVSQGVAELTVDETLQRAAQIRAEELAAYGDIRVNGVAHVRLDGSSWSTVLEEVGWAQGASHRTYGENCEMFTVCASLPAESSTLVNGWINSEGHRLNMINPDYTLIGVGVAWNGDTCYAVQLFGYYY